ncbi:MAG TPA: Gfo/Idh/MocA family oxidoreductase [Solirubrobacterales bacterium]|jgi:predicted dehydrogenase|nr:Gfo/Idh/MocA family oxidoreductase [Solirubrobacterales bacterium]
MGAAQGWNADRAGGSDAPIRVAVAGLGYWGTNVARNLEALPGCELAWCCDADPTRLDAHRQSFPRARFAADLEEALEDESVLAVAVATPVSTHSALAELVLAAGRHCFVEKPLACDVASAERVVEAAAARGLILMVGHLLAYHPALLTLKALCESGELGEIRYLYSQRLNLGRLRADENALWSLGAHDVSAILALTGALPDQVSARGASYVRDGVEDVVFAHLAFPDGRTAHIHVSWLDPRKERRLTVVGSKRMATFDDMQPERTLTVFDKGFDPDALGAGDYVARSGEQRSPAISRREPLQIELQHFLECLRGGTQPRTDGEEGLRVVRVLEALQESLEADGEAVSPLLHGASR